MKSFIGIALLTFYTCIFTIIYNFFGEYIAMWAFALYFLHLLEILTYNIASITLFYEEKLKK